MPAADRSPGLFRSGGLGYSAGITSSVSRKPGTIRPRLGRLRVGKGTVLLLALVAARAQTACSWEDSGPSRADEVSPGPASGDGPTGGSDAGAVAGRVVFQGREVPQPARLRNTTDPEQCGEVQSLENVLVSTDGGIANAVISLQDVPLPADYTPPASILVLDNRDCRFVPRVAVLTTGSRLETRNLDAFTHTVHLYGLFNVNVALGPDQSRPVRRLDRPGWYIVKCDLHGWMQAFLRVDEHPFHAVSSRSGEFQIRNIPPGTYRLEAWHEYFGRKEQEIRVRAGQVTRLTLGYPTPRKP